MQAEISLNNNAHSHSGLLPQEITVAGSNWLNRARHYPIFSLAWYRYRTLALLALNALACLLVGAIGSIHALAPMAGWMEVARTAANVVAPLFLVCLLGPGLAVALRRCRLPRHIESVATAVALLAGLAVSYGLGDALAQDYESPSFDERSGLLTTRTLPAFTFNFKVKWGGATVSAGPEIDKKYRPHYRPPPQKAMSPEERDAVLKNMTEKYGLTRTNNLKEGTTTFSSPAPPPTTTTKSTNLGPAIGVALVVLYLCWLGGIFDFIAFIRQRSRIVDVLQREELKRAQAARNAAEARLSVLAAQIEPHFLFNTLASVRSAIATDPQRAAQIVDHMVSFLRSTIPQMRDDASSVTVSLASQMESVRSYLALMHERIPRLQFSMLSEPGLDAAQLPPLMLISLVENAVKHGVEPKIGPAQIDVRARRVDEGAGLQLEVSVSDDGVGFGDATSGGGIGLANIQERLRTLFGHTASLTLKALPSGGVGAILRLPLSFES